MKQYYINPAGTLDKIGPVNEDTLKQSLQNGTYSMTSLVWCEGMPDWKPASSLFTGMAVPPLPQKLVPQKPRRIPGLGQPGAQYRPCPSSHLGSSITGLVFSCFTCLFVPGIVLNIIAIVRGSNVHGYWEKGNYTGAARSSSAACTLSNWAWILWGLWLVFIIVICAVD